MQENVFIVAEIGCNHNGDPKLAKKMVEEAKKCGVNAVKFQTFKADLLISKIAPKAEYQKKSYFFRREPTRYDKKIGIIL